MIRTKIAGKFGMIEHWAGRLLVAFSIYVWYKNKNIEHLILMILGIIYLTSHHLEKAFYGRYGSRG